jgi:hypothetical protein
MNRTDFDKKKFDADAYGHLYPKTEINLVTPVVPDEIKTNPWRVIKKNNKHRTPDFAP